jgi:hypothetical protein
VEGCEARLVVYEIMIEKSQRLLAALRYSLVVISGKFRYGYVATWVFLSLGKQDEYVHVHHYF